MVFGLETMASQLKDAGYLLGEESPASKVIGLVVVCEHAQWGRVGTLAEALGANEAHLPQHYQDVVAWSARAFQA